MIGGRISCRIRCLIQGITTVVIGCRGSDTVSYRHGSVIAVGVILEVVHHAGIGGCGFYIVVTVVCVGKGCTAGEDLLGKVIVDIFVGGVLTLNILYSGYIAVAVIGVAVSKLFLKKLNAVKADRIDIVIIGQCNSNGAVGFCGDHSCGVVLPMDIAVRIRVELCLELSGSTIRIVEGANNGKLSAGWLVNQSSSRCCWLYQRQPPAMPGEK